MIEALNGILAIIWCLLKIGVLVFAVIFVWLLVIELIKRTKK